MLWILTVVSLALLQNGSAEDCIEFDEHEAEIHKCCSYVPPYPREPMSQCQSQAEQKAEGDKHDFIACLFECYFKALGILSEEGTALKQDKIAEYLQPLNEEAREVLLAAYEECAAKTTGVMDVCNSYAMDVEMCAIHLFERRCPDGMFNPSEICNKVKAGVEFC